MYVHTLPLEPRPQGSALVSDNADMPVGRISPGDSVTLHCREVKIVAQVLELEPDQYMVGQILDFQGTLKPEIEGVNVGCYLRFKEKHVWAAHAA